MSALAVGGAPSASAATQTASCTDQSGVRWNVRAVWGGNYTDKVGTRRARLTHVGWTTKRRAVRTDSRVSTYNASGRRIQTLRWSGRFDYRNGSVSKMRNPRNPKLGARQPRVVVRLGVDGDGRADCAVTFRKPGAAAASSAGGTRAAPHSGLSVRSLAFSDEFSGTRLDTNKWSPCWFPGAYRGDLCGEMNGVGTSKQNVMVRNGAAVLRLTDQNTGALISSDPDGGARTGFAMTDGYYAEARIWFPGNGRTVYNWPAWWLTGQNHPETGENDIAEGLGEMTVNYHSRSGTHNQGTVPGVWSNGYHTYGIDRRANRSDVYFDGRLVKSYATDDDGAPQYLVLNVGTKASRAQVYGAGSAVKVDYVRVWKR